MAELITAAEARTAMALEPIDKINMLIQRKAELGRSSTNVNISDYDDDTINDITDTLLNAGYSVRRDDENNDYLIITW